MILESRDWGEGLEPWKAECGRLYRRDNGRGDDGLDCTTDNGFLRMFVDAE